MKIKSKSIEINEYICEVCGEASTSELKINCCEKNHKRENCTHSDASYGLRIKSIPNENCFELIVIQLCLKCEQEFAKTSSDLKLISDITTNKGLKELYDSLISEPEICKF